MGFWSPEFWINILLFILGYFPGLLHCYYIILIHPYQEQYISLGGVGQERGSDYGATN